MIAIFNGGCDMKLRILLLTALICSSFTVVNAQTGIYFGADLVAPTSGLGDVAGGGFGVNMGLVHPLNESVDFIGELGYNAYGGVRITDLSGSVEVQWEGIPIAVGVRINANKNLFLQAKGGVIHKAADTTDNLRNKVEETDTGWLLAPGAGVKLGKFGILAEYSISNNSWQWFGLKAFIQFGDSE